jgi:hypothetical protein
MTAKFCGKVVTFTAQNVGRKKEKNKRNGIRKRGNLMERMTKRFWLQSFGFIPCSYCDAIRGFAFGVYKEVFILCPKCAERHIKRDEVKRG